MTTMACVKHRDGWCVCAGTSIIYRDEVKTLCNHYIILPWGLEFRIPDCLECLKILEQKKRRA